MGFFLSHVAAPFGSSLARRLLVVRMLSEYGGPLENSPLLQNDGD